MNLNDVLSFGKQLADITDAIKTEMDGKSLKEFAEERANMPEQKQNNTGDKSKIHDTLQDVYLEDPMFAKRFKMCSTDQIEARYIFTTAFMSRFMKVAETFNYKLKAIFIDNNVYILINADKNWFELPFFKSCTDATNYKEFLVDFSRLISIVDVLKLNQNIGM